MRTNVTLILVEDNEVDALNFEHCTKAFVDRQAITKFTSAEDFLVEYEQKLPLPERIILFLDLTLPGLSGFGLLERLRQNESWCDVPVFITTSSTDPIDFGNAHRLGVSGYFCKPLDESNFAEVVESISLVRHSGKSGRASR